MERFSNQRPHKSDCAVAPPSNPVPTSIPPPVPFHCLLNLDHEPRARCLSRALLGMRIWCFCSSPVIHSTKSGHLLLLRSTVAPIILEEKMQSHKRWLQQSMAYNSEQHIHRTGLNPLPTPSPFELFPHLPTTFHHLLSPSQCLPTGAHSVRNDLFCPYCFSLVFQPHTAKNMILKKLSLNPLIRISNLLCFIQLHMKIALCYISHLLKILNNYLIYPQIL